MVWRAVKARRVLAALLRIGWRIKRQKGSHKVLERTGWPDVIFAFHDKKGKMGSTLFFQIPSTK